MEGGPVVNDRYDPPTADDQHAAAHRDCEAAWRCRGCQELVCPRHDPSPAEEELCADCFWREDPEGPTAA